MPAKRRPKGEGRYWFDAKTQQHRYRIRKGGRTYYVSDRDPRRARRKFADLKKQLDEGIKVEKSGQPFGDYVRKYLESAIRVGDNTAEDYARRASYYILPWLKRYALSDLSIDIGEAWVVALVKKGYAYSTIVQSLRLAQRILDRAVTERAIVYNPFAAIKPPRIEREETDEEEGKKAFTVEQEQALLADAKAHDRHWNGVDGRAGWVVRGEGLYLFYLLALRLGLRRGELLGLRRKDIDFKQGVIRVRQQAVKMDREVKLARRLKTPAAKRDLPLLEEIADVLRPHLLRLGGGDDALLFPGRDGGAKYPDAVTRQFGRACKRLGYVGYKFHDTRHTAITRWREQSVAAEVVAALAGHETPQVSLETYTHVTMDRKRRALGE